MSPHALVPVHTHSCVDGTVRDACCVCRIDSRCDRSARFAALSAAATRKLQSVEPLVHAYSREGDELMVNDLDLVQSDDVVYFGAEGCTWLPPPSESAENAVRLCTAAYTGNVVDVRALVLEEGCSIDAGDYDKRTAIHLAACEGRLEMIRMLVEEFGANVSPVDRFGDVPHGSCSPASPSSYSHGAF